MGKEYCKITVYPYGKTFNVKAGSNLGAVLGSRGLIRRPCGGRGLCGGCRVVVEGEVSEPTGNELKHGLGNLERLACQVRVVGDVKVTVYKRRISPVVEGLMPRVRVDPLAKTVIEGDVKAVRLNGEELIKTALEDEVFGVAVDLGTSKIACYLVDLEAGAVKGHAYTENPQMSFGADVITRMSAALRDDSAYGRMRAETLRCIEDVAAKLVRSNSERGRVAAVIAVGNTVMTHILFGLSLEPLSRYPFTHLVRRTLFRGSEIGFERILKESVIITVPPVGGFVGGDAVAAAGITLSLKPKHPSIMIDIGSNAEVALIQRYDSITFASAPAGPAMEGHVTCGTAGVEGGISRVYIEEITPSRVRFRLEVIGGGEPIGLTGSGLVSLIAELRRHGVVDAEGRIKSHYERVEGVKTIRIYEGPGREILLTQLDIREFQKAKSAIATAWQTLLKISGIEEVAEVYVAGSFGSYMSPDDLTYLGILPPLPPDKIVMLGNAAGTGATLSLINRGFYHKLLEISRTSHHVNIVTTPEFERLWLKNMLLQQTW